MKTERRHELQHNELWDWIAETGEKIKPYTTAILGVVIAVLVCVGVYTFLSDQAVKKQARSWNACWEALSEGSMDKRIDKLTEVTQNFAGTPAATWAQLQLADYKLDDGSRRLFVDKRSAVKDLEGAQENYAAIARSGAADALKQRALLGLGRTQESLNKLKEARDSYKELIEKYPKNPFTDIAKSRLESLDQDFNKRFFDWFARQEPVAPPPGKNGEKSPFSLEGMNLDLPKSAAPIDPNNLNLSEPAAGKDSTPFGKPSDTDATKAAPGKTDAPKADGGKSAAPKASDAGKDKAAPTPAAKDAAPPAKVDAAKTEAPKSGTSATPSK